MTSKPQTKLTNKKRRVAGERRQEAKAGAIAAEAIGAELDRLAKRAAEEAPMRRLAELNGVCPNDVRFVVQHALEALGVNMVALMGVDRSDVATTVLSHGLNQLTLEIRAAAELIGEDDKCFDILEGIAGRASLLGNAGYLLAQLNGVPQLNGAS